MGVGNVVRGRLGAAVPVTGIYVSKRGAGRGGIAKNGNSSTSGDGLGPFYTPRR